MIAMTTIFLRNRAIFRTGDSVRKFRYAVTDVRPSLSFHVLNLIKGLRQSQNYFHQFACFDFLSYKVDPEEFCPA